MERIDGDDFCSWQNTHDLRAGLADQQANDTGFMRGVRWAPVGTADACQFDVSPRQTRMSRIDAGIDDADDFRQCTLQVICLPARHDEGFAAGAQAFAHRLVGSNGGALEDIVRCSLGIGCHIADRCRAFVEMRPSGGSMRLTL